MTMQEKIRPGYKQTDIGVIPEDWSIKSVKCLGEIVTGGTPPTTNCSLWGSGFPWVTPSDIKGKRDIVETERSVTDAGIQFLHKLPAGAVLVTCIASIGKNAILRAAGACNQQINALIPSSLNSGDFLYYLFEHNVERLKASAGITATPIISKTIFECIVFGIPHISEQVLIAEALSDADARIAALEALVAKKRDLKQAAMQQLLTGKTRLPGFSGEWEVKRLGKIGEISGAGVDKKVREGEQPVRLVNYMDAYRRTFIRSADLEHWVTAPQHQLRRCTVEKGDVFFTPSSEIRDDIANSAVAIEDIPDTAYSYHVVRLRIKDAWDLRFRAYAFQTREFLDQAQVICDGSGTRYVISLGKFRGMTVTVPERDEQAAIAEILSDMDSDLAALEAETEKARTIKQGMMQTLLTGKVRLV